MEFGERRMARRMEYSHDTQRLWSDRLEREITVNLTGSRIEMFIEQIRRSSHALDVALRYYFVM